MKPFNLILALAIGASAAAVGQCHHPKPLYPPCHRVPWEGKPKHMWTGGVVSGHVFFETKRKCKQYAKHPVTLYGL